MNRATRALLGLWTALLVLVAAFPAQAETYYVEGHGGVPLAVTVTGPEDAPAILFLHGIGMGADAFSPQLESDLAGSFRMVAFDLRGHGFSGKPWNADAYTAREAWAGDVERVVAATGIERPVIVAWSYGTLVAADYLLAHGTDAISGLILVSALGGLTPPVPPEGPPDPQVMAQLEQSRALRSVPSLPAQQRAVELLNPLLYEITDTGPSEDWQERAAMLGAMVPSFAQPHLRAHPADNVGLVDRLSATPLMVVAGERDLALTGHALDAFAAALPHARIEVLAGAGHSLFAERPQAFNALLANFTTLNWSPDHGPSPAD